MNRVVNGQQAWELDERRDEVEEPLVEAVSEVEELTAESLEESLPQEPTMDSVQHYLQEIGRVSLLSAAEEVELAERMERGSAATHRLEEGEHVTPQLRMALHADIAS